MKQEIKRYVISSFITFASTFILLVGFAINELDWEKATMASLYSIIFTALRGAFKIAWEVLVPLFYKLIEYAKSKLR